ncbi:MAG TPA: DNA polymerase III subunit gamma/tau [Alphaproteobacteria bacterium]|jgi:DNA polymerase-3 subunit gamma/tau|nr:DNA polymerase III subunit gamma/tau [Alphaproteobacteria bacterium]
MTLYLKYRPKNLDELDLKDVGESLKKILSSQNLPHAFLFAGPKGTGKTSAARIVAKIVNCERSTVNSEPCDKCESCLSITNGSNLDVIEMDAASHRGIDDVRMLRDAVKLAPTNSKKKIYIIDEAHMLTTEASNALLKTLEEPPAHVIFILATTNPEKLIDTIKSRVTYIAFRKATEEEIKHSLKRVVAGEKMKVDDEVLNHIAKLSNGSFRDGVKLLEQVNMEGAEFLTKNSISGIDEFITLLYKKDVEKLLESVKNYVKSGISIENFIKEILLQIHADLLEDVAERKSLILLAELLIEANAKIVDSPIEELPLEIAIIKWSQSDRETGDRRQKTVEITIETEPTPDFQLPTSSLGVNDDICPAEQDLALPEKNISFDSLQNNAWTDILSKVKPINASIEALLRSSRPITYDGNILTLGVFYKFHKERLEDMRHRKVLEDVITQVLNSPTKVACILVDPPIMEAKVDPILTEGKDQDILKAAEEIFSN